MRSILLLSIYSYVLRDNFSLAVVDVWGLRCMYVGDEMGAMLSVLFLRRGAVVYLCRTCVHPVAVLRAAFCMPCSLLMLVDDARGDHMDYR